MAEKTNLENPEKLGIHLSAGAGDGMLTSALYIYNESEEVSIQDTHTTTVSIEADSDGNLLIDNASIREDVTLEMANSEDPVVLKSYVDALIKRIETLEALNKPKYTIKIYNYQGGSVLETRTVKEGDSVTAPANDPTRTGYVFSKWSKTFPFIATEDTNVYGEWTKRSYTVTFYDYSGGNVLSTQSVLYKEAATAPATPTRDGWTFDGWDKTFTSITTNTTICGKWTPVSEDDDDLGLGAKWRNHALATDPDTEDQNIIDTLERYPYTGASPEDMMGFVDETMPTAYNEDEDNYAFTAEQIEELIPNFYVPAGYEVLSLGGTYFTVVYKNGYSMWYGELDPETEGYRYNDKNFYVYEGDEYTVVIGDTGAQGKIIISA